MTTAGESRTIRVGALARVEGEGALHVRVEEGSVTDVRLEIFEPPRFFEALLRDRAATDAPDVTARICGICPVAYQVSACAAVEEALGIEVDEQTLALRRLLYCGEWLESHSLHVFMLHAPDFLGYDGAIEMARDGHGQLFEQGLLIKRAGTQLISAIGGRAVHPVNLRVGGFHRPLRGSELGDVAESLRRARDQLLETVAWTGGLDFPDRQSSVELAALGGRDARYPFEGGELHSSAGEPIGADAFERDYLETQVPHSTALHCSHRVRGTYLVGPLARYGLFSDRLPAFIQEAAREAGLGRRCENPFQSIIVRCIEMLYAADEALRLIEDYEPPDPAPEPELRPGVGCGWSEAPRGMLWHRYELRPDGRIADARIVPPTSQNQPAIEAELAELVEANLGASEDELQWLCEQAVRNYDPCISCATHSLELMLEHA